MDKPKSLALVERYALVPTNPNVQKLASRLHWKPQTAIDRIQRALPAPMEQQIYLALAGSFAILPESMAKLLRMFLGHEELELGDIAPRPVGRNLVSSKFSSFAEFLRECLNLLKIITNEYSAFHLSIEQAGFIVLHYGTDNPELLIEMVDNNLEEMCEVLNISNKQAYSVRMRLCIWLVVSKIIPDNRRRGQMDALDIADFLEMSSARRHQLRRALSLEVPDYLSADADELRGYEALGILKREGVI